MYAFYYIQEAGIPEPWNNPNIKVRASGDDVVILCDPTLKERITASILTLTSRIKRSENPVGLGQCVEKVDSGLWFEFDFCSKWTFGNTHENFGVTRDIYKTMTTKQYYSKQNA